MSCCHARRAWLSRPTLPATTRDAAGVPDWLGLLRHVVLDLAGVLRGDGVDDLPVAERVPVPAEVGGQVDGCFRGAGADDEPQVRFLQAVRLAADNMPASATTTMSAMP